MSILIVITYITIYIQHILPVANIGYNVGGAKCPSLPLFAPIIFKVNTHSIIKSSFQGVLTKC